MSFSLSLSLSPLTPYSDRRFDLTLKEEKEKRTKNEIKSKRNIENGFEVKKWNGRKEKKKKKKERKKETKNGHF